MTKLTTFDDFQNQGGITGLDGWANYAGDTSRSSWYLAPVSRNRESDCLSLSNFDAALERLGGESDTVIIANFGHWACGWYELILIDPADKKAVSEAESIQADMDSYPVLNEGDFSEREWEEATRVWNDCYNLEERIQLCAEYGVSIFAARHEYIPDDGAGRIYDYLTTR